jgi:hypothetical protein
MTTPFDSIPQPKGSGGYSPQPADSIEDKLQRDLRGQQGHQPPPPKAAGPPIQGPVAPGPRQRGGHAYDPNKGPTGQFNPNMQIDRSMTTTSGWEPLTPLPTVEHGPDGPPEGVPPTSGGSTLSEQHGQWPTWQLRMFEHQLRQLDKQAERHAQDSAQDYAQNFRADYERRTRELDRDFDHELKRLGW